MTDSIRAVGTSLVPLLRRALRPALLRHQADYAAGRETDDVHALGERLAALLVEKHSSGPDAVTDMEMRAAVAAALAAELEAIEDGGR